MVNKIGIKKNDLLAKYKKSNKDRRKKIIVKYGFTTESKFIDFLTGTKKVSVKKQILAVKTNNRGKKPTIHNVHILDRSGSMHDKISGALEGINADIEALKTNNKANFTQTIVSFSSGFDIKQDIFMVNINDVSKYKTYSGGGTALYQATGETLTNLRKMIKKGEKVLVKIFTDGEENASTGEFKDPKVLETLIKECEKEGFTITFVGTKFDVNAVIKDLGIHASNTLVHDNTLSGVQKSFRTSNRSTTVYTTSVVKGLDVKEGFYKQTGVLED